MEKRHLERHREEVPVLKQLDFIKVEATVPELRFYLPEAPVQISKYKLSARLVKWKKRV